MHILLKPGQLLFYLALDFHLQHNRDLATNSLVGGE
jgi:hypothetical protein